MGFLFQSRSNSTVGKSDDVVQIFDFTEIRIRGCSNLDTPLQITNIKILHSDSLVVIAQYYSNVRLLWNLNSVMLKFRDVLKFHNLPQSDNVANLCVLDYTNWSYFRATEMGFNGVKLHWFVGAVYRTFYDINQSLLD